MKTQTKQNLVKTGILPAFFDGLAKLFTKLINALLDLNLLVVSGIVRLIGTRNGALIVSIVGLGIAYNTHSVFTGELTFYDHISVFVGRIARASL